ncbi:MAG: cell division protein FtsZ [Synergistaceae bacterium]|nr:cell division protein FtsZ [Synergistaceae bacterium]MBQ6908608.1 cell division protein FtsZ [Synergistaceae bacterium]MBQ7569629.1 cell division protein FtsZ [Synergistaceae bacterium]MBR0220229.1 cell division protein FtsZ [Synergistaceae bacterium]
MDQNLFQVSESNVQGRENIIVFGVGGGGGNALNHIIESGVEGVDFVAANTDKKALDLNKAPNKIILGEKLTRGLGAGANPTVGQDAAKESMDRIKDYITGADMIFVTAGMGGGTGTGAAPVIAEAAKEMGILVVGVVTLPFSFEMQKRLKTAQSGIENLRKNVDALLVVENDRLLQIADDKLKIVDAYKMVDEVLRQAVQGVTDLITKPGFINLDFADIKAIMTNAGSAIMGIGVGNGDNRAEDAARSAIKSPLMSVPMEGAKGILLNVTTGEEFTLHEMNKTAEVIRATADPDANVIWGHVIDPDIGDSIRVTLIATGFPEGKVKPVVNNRQQAPVSNSNNNINNNRQRMDNLQYEDEPQPAATRQIPRGVRVPQPLQQTGRQNDQQQITTPPRRTIYNPANRTQTINEGFEESRLQTPNDERDASHGLPRMNYDQPAIYRRTFKS